MEVYFIKVAFKITDVLSNFTCPESHWELTQQVIYAPGY